jgi:hypothetical protein
MSPEALLLSHRNLWKKALSPLYSLKRMLRSLLTLRPGALCLSLFMDGFYMYKRISRNYPMDMNKYPVAHWEEYVPTTGNIPRPERRMTASQD